MPRTSSQSISRPANVFRTIRSSAQQVRRNNPAGVVGDDAPPLLEGEPSERNVETHGVAGLDENHAARQRQLARPVHPGPESGQERIHERLFAPEAGEQGQVGIGRRSRLSPAGNDDAADEAEPPAP